jgi:hypothetical protein
MAPVFPSGEEQGFTFDRGGNNVIPKDSKKGDVGSLSTY